LKVKGGIHSVGEEQGSRAQERAANRHMIQPVLASLTEAEAAGIEMQLLIALDQTRRCQILILV
jgi:hypothetical protein